MTVRTAQVMVVSPHADDAELGAGGTIARWVKEGREVVYVLCTNGDKGTTDLSINPAHLAKVREQEQLAAARVLGVRDVVFLRHPDQGLEDTSEFRKQLVRLIRMFRPDTVLTIDPYRRYLCHRDHRITGQVTLDAIYPCARDRLSYPELLRAGLEPHKVKEVLLWSSEDTNYFLDITATFELKLAALKCHQSQVGHIPTAQLEDWLRSRCREMATGQDFELAEGFHMVEMHNTSPM